MTISRIVSNFCKCFPVLFSIVSKPDFASKYAFNTIFQGLQYLHTFAPLKTQYFSKTISNNQRFHEISFFAKTSHFVYCLSWLLSILLALQKHCSYWLKLAVLGRNLVLVEATDAAIEFLMKHSRLVFSWCTMGSVYIYESRLRRVFACLWGDSTQFPGCWDFARLASTSVLLLARAGSFLGRLDRWDEVFGRIAGCHAFEGHFLARFRRCSWLRPRLYEQKDVTRCYKLITTIESCCKSFEVSRQISNPHGALQRAKICPSTFSATSVSIRPRHPAARKNMFDGVWFFSPFHILFRWL